MHNHKILLKIPLSIIGSLIIIIILGSNCMRRDEYYTRDNDHNQGNQTTTFIYNMIPQDMNAIISPEYSRAINRFSVNLLQRIYINSNFVNKNLVISPFSVSRNLSVLAEGTVGESQQELLTALGGKVALDDAKSALSQLLYADNSVILQCADALWINSGNYTLKDAFREKIVSKYGVEIAGLDFNDVSHTVKTINQWVSKNTLHYIQQILTPDDIAASTALFLGNAIYFEADWASPFDISKTRMSSFYAPSGEVKAPMMESKYRHKTYKTATYENVKLYYGSKKKDFFYLDIYMPTTIPLNSFITNHCLTALSIQDSMRMGSLSMPKFFFHTEIDLIPVLQELGIIGIFTPGKGEIREIVTNPNADLFVYKVMHKAGIKTDEEGTTAFAVTVSGAMTVSGGPSPDVYLDHPFVYFIRAGVNGLVLFAGVVNNPNKT